MKPKFGKAQLVEHLRDLGVKKGSVLMAHVSYKSIAPIDGTPLTVIEALLEAVGDSGTLIVPTFTFSFCETRKWNRQESPSESGFITELARNQSNAKRSCHPIYSVAAFGEKSDDYKACNDKNGIGDQSPFRLLVKHDAIMSLIGVGYNQGFPLGHHIEWKQNVDYRVLKKFRGVVIDNNVVSENDYSMSARNLEEGILTDFRKLGWMLEQQGAMKVGRFGWAIARCVRAREYYTLCEKWLKDEVPNLMHRKESEITKEEKDKLIEDYFSNLSF